MRGFLVFLGILFALGGGALAGAQYAPVDLAPLNSVAGAREFVASPMALYAGGGAAGFGLLLIVIGAATGGAKKAKPAQAKTSAASHAASARRAEVSPQTAAPAPKAMAAAAAPAAKPTASAHPPQTSASESVDTRMIHPRLLNRRRVTDLVSINDALKAYYAANGAYPKATGLAGFSERGAGWIPGLSPDFIVTLPRDPLQASDASGPQYVYVSDGKDYKLLAHGVSLVGGTQVEVLGVRIDPTRNPTAENASFGFWTVGFASV